MNDIVERLRDGGVFPMTFGGPDVKDVAILYDPMTTTDAIKEIERLRAALLKITNSVHGSFDDAHVMADIARRDSRWTEGLTDQQLEAMCDEAADEIERLRADNERLKAALNKIMRNDPEGYAPNIARRALEANDE